MNQIRFLLSTLFVFSSLSAFAYINDKVFQLSPNFHQLLVISENADGKCELDHEKSIWMDKYENHYLDRLVSAKMVIKHAPENGYFSIQILAETSAKLDAVKADIIGNAWVVDSFVNKWTRTPKAQHFMITENKKCASKIVLLVKSVNVSVH